MDPKRNILRSATDFAAFTAENFISPGDVVVDATCGNGRDTLFLASRRPSKLYAFDIQASAVASTRELLISSGYRQQLCSGAFSLINASHSFIARYVKERPRVIMFNLGYLPGGSRAVTTSASSTIEAVKASLSILNPGGLICVTMYSGHPEGAEEQEALLSFSSALDSSLYHVSTVTMINQRSHPPQNLFITSKAPY